MPHDNIPYLHAVFPRTRMRRKRRTLWIRRLVAETRLQIDDLIWPVFVVEGTKVRDPVPSMPGVVRMSIDQLIEAAKQIVDIGIPGILLFPVLSSKERSDEATEAYNPENLICRAIQALKFATPSLGVIADVALDPYTSHGHDGLMAKGIILNDETIEILVRQALVLARAGVDIIAPSDMMDGRIGILRTALDENNYQHIAICSYAAKYASRFYAPFREAIHCAEILKGDKRTYQMDPANCDEALHEVALDIQEGTDMIMVKPGLPYLDVVSRVKKTFQIPTFVYHVSGEYVMLKAAAEKGWLDYHQTLLEIMLSFKRAGADAIITYAAIEVASLLNQTHGESQ